MNMVHDFRQLSNELLHEIQTEYLLEIKDFSLTIERFENGFTPERLHVIRDFHLKIRRGEVVAIVGASGSGKSLLADAILGIHPENSVIEGTMNYENALLTEKRKKQMRKGEIMLIPQMTNALDPLMKVGKQVKAFVKENKKQEVLKNLFQRVGLEEKTMGQLPSTLSGGMIRKIFISMAIASKAKLIIADEPTNGLDNEAVQEMLFQLKMLARNQRGVVMITHDLEAALQIADQIAVFYGGETVEIVARNNFSKKNKKFRHPYSNALWEALPQNGFVPMDCSQPSPSEHIKGCIFSPHCPKASKVCKQNRPKLQKIGNDEMVRCFYA